MLSESLMVTTLVVTDLDEAKRFYETRLGLRLLEETPTSCRFGAGKGSQLTIRRGPTSVSGQTVAHFEVDDLDAVVRALIAGGVVFDEYETPRTVDFIARLGPVRAAWFRDPAGNVLGLREGPVPAPG